MKIVIKEKLADFIQNYDNARTIDDEITNAIEHYIYNYFKVESTHNASLMLDDFSIDIDLKITLWGE
jgi:hypothetical protein